MQKINFPYLMNELETVVSQLLRVIKGFSDFSERKAIDQVLF